MCLIERFRLKLHFLPYHEQEKLWYKIDSISPNINLLCLIEQVDEV